MTQFNTLTLSADNFTRFYYQPAFIFIVKAR